MRTSRPRSLKFSDLGIAAAVLLMVACTTADSAGPAQLIPPRFRVRLPSGQILPSGYSPSTSIELMVDIFNDSSEPITLKRLQLQSVVGGLRFLPTSRLFNKTIPAHGVETFDLGVDVSAESPGLDVRAPVTVRGTAVFDSPAGAFRRVFTTELVESRPGRE
jgi:hypothetical protein